MAKNGDGEFAFSICQIRHFAIGPPPPFDIIVYFLDNLDIARLRCLQLDNGFR